MGMKASKYVIIEEITPVVFQSPLSHKDMLALGRVTSAGYFVRDGDDILISGEAVTIEIKNGKHDQALLARFYKESVMGR
jgi:hypothetical protein